MAGMVASTKMMTAELRTERKGVALQLINAVEHYTQDLGADEDRIESELRRERSASGPMAGPMVRLYPCSP